jgi:hypothetical protein
VLEDRLTTLRKEAVIAWRAHTAYIIDNMQYLAIQELLKMGHYKITFEQEIDAIFASLQIVKQKLQTKPRKAFYSLSPY